MHNSVQLQAKRHALVEDLVELAATDMGIDISEPMPSSLRDVVWNEVMAAYLAWRDLIEMSAHVEATSRVEKALVELCHLDRSIRCALRHEEQCQ
jgi:hypothetical protein